MPGLRQAGKWIHLILAAILICSLTGCGASGTKGKSDADAGHAPITIMSANKDDSGFFEYVKSVYPEIDIQIVPYRGANTTQYMFDQLHTGHMPDIYSTTQMFTCYDKYPEHLIDLSKYGFTSKYKYELEALAPVIEAAGYTLSDCTTSLPGFGFQHLCNIADTTFLRSIEGIKWQRDFLAGNATAAALRGLGKHHGGSGQCVLRLPARGMHRRGRDGAHGCAADGEPLRRRAHRPVRDRTAPQALAVFEFSVRRAGQWLRHDGGIRRHHIRHVHPRGNSVTNKVQDTDLGMAITKRLVKRMGSQVSLKMQKGKGSVFTIDLELRLPDATDNVSFYCHDRQCLLGGHSHGSAPGARAGIAPGSCLRRMGSAEILQLYLWSVDVIHICEYNCIGRFRCSCTDNRKYAKRLAAPC